MSHSSLFDKVEALMRKHRGEAVADADPPAPAERQAPPAEVWLPVLTDVIERGATPVSSEARAHAEEGASELSSIAPTVEEAHIPASSEAPPEPVEATSQSHEPAAQPQLVPPSTTIMKGSAEARPDEHVAENLVNELTPRISGLMQEQVAEELRKSLDQSMANLMASLNANVEEIVRQAVAEKLADKNTKPD